MWSWWVGVALFVLIIGYFIYAVVRSPADRSLEETLPKEAPLPVPLERDAIGVQAILRIPIRWSHGRKEKRARFAAWRPDGEVVAAVVHEALRFWDAQSGADRTQGGRRFLTWGSSDFEALAWSRDGKRIYAVTRQQDRDVLLEWNAATGERSAQQELQGATVTSIVPAPDGAGIAWLGSRALGTWEPGSGTVRRADHDSTYIALDYVRRTDGRTALVTVNNRYEIEHWAPESLEILDTRPVETNLHFLGLVDHGNVAVFAFNDAVELVETQSGRISARRDGFPDDLSCVCGGPGFVAFGSGGGRIVLCSPEDLEVLAEAQVDGRVDELTAAPGGLLLSLAEQGTFETHGEIWNSTRLMERWARRSGV